MEFLKNQYQDDSWDKKIIKNKINRYENVSWNKKHSDIQGGLSVQDASILGWKKEKRKEKQCLRNNRYILPRNHQSMDASKENGLLNRDIPFIVTGFYSTPA